MKTYIKIITTDGYEFIQVNNENIISSIPIDPANADYQDYLRSLENPDAEEGETL